MIYSLLADEGEFFSNRFENFSKIANYSNALEIL